MSVIISETREVPVRQPRDARALEPKPVYKFVKVEDYFSDYQNWYTLKTVISHNFDHVITLSLTFQRNDGKQCAMLLQFPRKDTMWVRFHPDNATADAYTSQHTRMVVMDSLNDFLDNTARVVVDYREQVETENNHSLHLTTKGEDDQPFMEVVVNCNPFWIAVHKCLGEQRFQVWKTAVPAIYYVPNSDGEYSIIQSVEKPATAKYIGFGEQGGEALNKNTAQLTYFNFDNMRYRQVYNAGPFENREPLYHSDPFFMEFNGVPDRDSIYGIYVNKPSQVCVDVGYLSSRRYMFGTRFDDLNYYFYLGETCADVLTAFTAFVGRPKLKPRYILGYHQGCYGYEDRNALETTVSRYRDSQVPLDGLHIDVDIQHNYQTFTIDEAKFPNPREMFARLKERGIKCSTNITPIISNKDGHYKTYSEGLANGYFVLDKRVDADDPAGWHYQDYNGGNECYQDFVDPEHTFNSGQPFVGEVYYGGDRGTTGHYADLGRSDVRRWWGAQYQYLFDMGLEMVWQDMTTPAIRTTRGDMRGFPFRLLVTDDFLSNIPPRQTAAIKIWNLYAYNLHKATYHGLNALKGRENTRNFIIGRGSFTGMHRFAGLWTGDNASSWDFLKINISQVLALGLSGVAISGEDIGGFEREEDWQHWADPELLIRWTCVGAFLPWFRNHYIAKGMKFFQEPYAYQTVDLDQWNVPQEKRYLYSSVLPICRHYIELRYRLMQLFYDAMFENVFDGMPICRAMILNDPGDRALYNDKLSFLDNQFFVRRDLLVAPFLEAQADYNQFGRRDVYLPAGSDWYTFVDNRQPLTNVIEGGTTVHHFDAHIEASNEHMSFHVPIYVRAGAIIPTLELEQYVGERNARGDANPLTFNIYPGQSGQYTMYLDDGISRSSAPDGLKGGDTQARGEYRETRITHTLLNDGMSREIKIERIRDNYTPRFEAYFFVAILHDPNEARGSNGPLLRIKRDQRDIRPIMDGSPESRAAQLNASSEDAWYYNENIRVSFIKVLDSSPWINLMADYV
jgi:alpha-glucosidase